MAEPMKLCPNCNQIATIYALNCEKCGHQYRTKFEPTVGFYPHAPAAPTMDTNTIDAVFVPLPVRQPKVRVNALPSRWQVLGAVKIMGSIVLTMAILLSVYFAGRGGTSEKPVPAPIESPATLPPMLPAAAAAGRPSLEAMLSMHSGMSEQAVTNLLGSALSIEHRNDESDAWYYEAENGKHYYVIFRGGLLSSISATLDAQAR